MHCRARRPFHPQRFWDLLQAHFLVQEVEQEMAEEEEEEGRAQQGEGAAAKRAERAAAPVSPVAGREAEGAAGEAAAAKRSALHANFGQVWGRCCLCPAWPCHRM